MTGLATAPVRGVIARGLGRSYGDAAQNAGGRVLDLTALDAIMTLDAAGGHVTAQAGASFDRLIRTLVPRGLFVPVTPGTREVTLGGAVACDVHGKNHHVDGGFGAYVERMTLATPAGELRELRPGTAAFDATVGGVGLTGVVVDLTLRLITIETSSVLVDTERGENLDEVMTRMSEGDERYRYSVAWIDCTTTGRRLGRGVLTRANHAMRDDLPRRDGELLRFAPSSRLRAPALVPSALVNRHSVHAFNEVWFRKSPRERRREPQSLAAFFHPLDGVRDWNRLYGPRGFLQYQLVVPFGREDTVSQVIERFTAAGVPSFLAVLKRLGPASGMLSFPSAGWTLALDVPLGVDGLEALLDGVDELVAGAGGRVYLAKDSRLRPDLLEAMYPAVPRWRRAQRELDPDGRMRSDLSRRLGITA